MNSGIFAQSLIIGYSIICVSPLIKSLEIKNRFIVYGTSFSLFWGFTALLSIFLIFFEKTFLINIYDSLIVLLIILFFSIFINKVSKNKLNLENFIVFVCVSSITYFISTIQLPKIRGGDGFWLAQIAISLSDGAFGSGDFAGAGHRAPLWILLESFSLMVSNYFLLNFQYICAFLTLLILISIILEKLKRSRDKFIFLLLFLCLISSPAYIALSIYFEIHAFGSLLVILLWYYSQMHSYNNNKYFSNSFVILLLSSTLSLARFEGILLALPFLYKFYKINRSLVDLKIYFTLFTLNSLWYLNLINIGIVHKSSSEYIFLVIAVIPFLSFAVFSFINKYLSFQKLLIIELTTFFILLLFSYEFREIVVTFLNILNFYGGWGSTGPLFLIIIFYLIFQFIKKSYINKSILNDYISIILLLGLQLLTFFGNTTLGWRYGLSSSANRLFYMVLPILILDFYKEFKSNQRTS